MCIVCSDLNIFQVRTLHYILQVYMPHHLLLMWSAYVW